MKYVDSHHKRTDFTATSFVMEAGPEGRGLVFAGHGLHASVVLRECGESIAAVVPEFKEEFVLRKVQILERQRWLTLDFEGYPNLSRILIYIDELNSRQLADALREMIGQRKLLFHHYNT